MTMRKRTSFFFLATLACCTFEKLHWSFGGQLALADVLALGFIVCYALLSRPRVPRTTAVLTPEWRMRLDRRTRAQELADLIHSLDKK